MSEEKKPFSVDFSLEKIHLDQWEKNELQDIINEEKTCGTSNKRFGFTDTTEDVASMITELLGDKLNKKTVIELLIRKSAKDLIQRELFLKYHRKRGGESEGNNGL